MTDWSTKDLKAVMTDESAGASKKAAARVWLHATTDQTNAAGSPIAGSEFDRIFDRTLGKAAQSIDVTSEGKSLSFTFVVAQPTDGSPSNTDQDPAEAG